MNTKYTHNRNIQIRFSTGDAGVFIETLKELKNARIHTEQIFMPSYVQEIKDINPIKRTMIPLTGIIGGFIGLLIGFLLQYWVSTIAYPLNFGGKPFFAFPSFVPVIFECAVLFASVFIVVSFLWKTLHKNSEEINELLSKDEYVILITKDIDSIPEKINKYLLSGELSLIKIGC